MRIACVVIPCFGAQIRGLKRDDPEGVWEEVLSLLAFFSLRVEPDGCGTAYLDMTKSLRTLGPEPAAVRQMKERIFHGLGLTARAGMGNSRFVSRAAASCGDRCGWVVPPGGEKSFLGSLDSSILPVSDEVKERLCLLGLNRLGKIAFLSLDVMATQFGPLGRDMWRWAGGMEEHRPVPLRHVSTYMKREIALDDPIETINEAKGPIGALVEGLAGDLDGAGMACGKVKILFALQNGDRCERRFLFHLPTARKEEIARRLGAAIEGLTVEAPVTGLALYAFNLSPRGPVQGALFRTRPRHTEAMDTVKGYLRARYGEVPVMKVCEDARSAYVPEKRFLFEEL